MFRMANWFLGISMEHGAQGSGYGAQGMEHGVVPRPNLSTLGPSLAQSTGLMAECFSKSELFRSYF